MAAYDCFLPGASRELNNDEVEVEVRAEVEEQRELIAHRSFSTWASTSTRTFR